MNQKKDKIQLSDHFTYGAVYFPVHPDMLPSR